MTLLKSRTLIVSINCDSKKVYEFVTDLTNLPQWAKTFCRSIRRVKSQWIIETAQGPCKIRIAKKNDLGVLDHYLTPSRGSEVFVPMRVVPNGSGSEVVFTVFQQPGIREHRLADIVQIDHA